MSSIVIKGNTSGQVEIAAPDIAGSTTLTLPTGSGSIIKDDGSGNLSPTGGIYLGGTASANLLDDYEEGTWTITNNGDATGVINAEDGRYIKIGNMVYVWGQLGISTNFTSGSFGGLPFIVQNTPTLSNNTSHGVGTATGITGVIVYTAIKNSNAISLTNNGNVLGSHVPNTANDVYRFSLIYPTN